ncbi:muts domain V-domain-containing protein [Lineolata rhizophorae]|uniref:Muts domain V-domain-containing protein n=1 Tax=Lineolata rhizophorae TaxID=578093 RepID=A0A6A6NT77_9PEZI|nr:muts domain V-domain-containing protein [Lineolata rhizophorae]
MHTQGYVASASTTRSQGYSYSYSYLDGTTTTSQPRRSDGRAGTARPRTGYSTIGGAENQRVICALSESRGVSPTVGLAFVNLDTAEASLSQICDTQTYVRTLNKLIVYSPSEILIISTAAQPKSKLFSIVEENLLETNSFLTLLDRRYWAESTGFDYIQQLAFQEDVEAVKNAIGKNYFAVCSFAAALKHIELGLNMTFPKNALRIKYEPAEGTMMIDVSTIRSLELIQNLEDPKSKYCLFGLLNETQTPMGARMLRSNILQPLTDQGTLTRRYDALEELTTKEEMFYSIRQGKLFLDMDKILSALIVIPSKETIQHAEQSINNIIMLKQFANSIDPIYIALAGVSSQLLKDIRSYCSPVYINPVIELINSVINEDATFANQPLELRNQRTYAVKSGLHGLLDVARTIFKESTDDAYQYVENLQENENLNLELKYDNARQFYIRIPAQDLEERNLPSIFTNVFRKKNKIECQTLDLIKCNQKIFDSHQEVVSCSNQAVQQLTEDVRGHISNLSKICESIALLDMLSSFAQLVTCQDYVKPRLGDTLAIKSGRHPIRDKFQKERFIPNDVYATQQTRFQIITGCNMSGKSTYIRSIALLSVMVQIGCFVPAEFAAFPVLYQLFARVSADDSIEANVSTFASEMRETAFILRNIDHRSMAIIDELGRGTSPRDGLAIAIAISEALVDSHALVWFATHFHEVSSILSERPGVVSMHLEVEMPTADRHKMTMLYRIAPGPTTASHYGLALARVMPLPGIVLEHAERVASHLDDMARRRSMTSAAVLTQRRRKLVLSLKEQLSQARESNMRDEVLSRWLKQLQIEFVRRMQALEDEVAEAAAGAAQRSESNDHEIDGSDKGENDSVDLLPCSGGRNGTGSRTISA